MGKNNYHWAVALKSMLIDLPDFPEGEIAQRAYFIQQIFLTISVLWLCGIFVYPFMVGANSFYQFLAMHITIGLVLVTVRWLILQGQIANAGLFLSLPIWGFFAVSSLMGTGLTGMSYILLITLTPFLTGFAYGTGLSVLVTIINSMLGFWLAFQESRGVLQIGSDYDPWLRQTSYVLVFSVLPFMVFVWRRSIDQSIGLAHKAFSAELEKGAALRQADLLELAVEKRTEELVLAKKEADQSNQAKSIFLANMSHEMRTPLNAIIGYSEMVHETAVDNEDFDSADDMVKIQLAGRHLLAIIGNILDLTKIESGRMELHFEEVNLEALIAEVVSIMSNPIKLQDNQLKVSNHSSVQEFESDYMKLKQIMINLIGNACKFSQGSEIDLNISDQLTSGESQPALVISVSDNGVGIAKDQLESIFKPFYQADNSLSREINGTGLGLAIAQAYASELHGKLEVESTLGVGSIFKITLPL